LGRDKGMGGKVELEAGPGLFCGQKKLLGIPGREEGGHEIEGLRQGLLRGKFKLKHPAEQGAPGFHENALDHGQRQKGRISPEPHGEDQGQRNEQPK
jgi:hypothetical protein